MGENRTFRAKMAANKNALADYVKNGDTVIVLKHCLLVSMDKELNEVKGQKKAFKVLGKVYLVMGIMDPLMWLGSVACFLFGGILKDEIKGYDVYNGQDVNNENIIVLIRKKDNVSYDDTIIYDGYYVKSVSQKPLQGKIKA